MIDWDSYLPEVLPDLPGAPDTQVINAVRNAAIEFAEYSLLLRKTLPLINVVKDVRDYPIAASESSTQLIRTIASLRILFDGIAAHPLSEDNKYGRSNATQEYPYRYSMEGPELLHLEWIPDANITNGLSVRIAYKPLPTAVDADDILFYDWHEHIAAGAKARMQISPDKKWSNRAAASVNDSFFRAGINLAWGRANKSHSKTSTRLRFQPLSGGYRRGDQGI